MTREPIYHCNGPDCDRHQQSMNRPPLRGWIEVRDGDNPGEIMDFCSWDCVMKFAAAQPPVEVLP